MSVQVHNIRKAFGNFVALDDVTLDFPTGELTALLGPSGCGKTTLLRVIAGLETPDSGQVLLDRTDASATNVRERRVGFVFQHYALFRHMTVFDNVAFGLRVKPRKERPDDATIARRVHELLNLVQLDWLADRYPPQLSGGQRQRIALARALAVEPRVLLLDEPFGALDAKVRKELRRWLRRLHDELHITSVFVTHDQDEAMEVADRVVLMNHGRVEQVGTPHAVYERPATPFVYGFLGAVTRFDARAENGLVRVAGEPIAIDPSAARNGAVQAYARPHELRIHTDPTAGGLAARVVRVLSFGAASRIELLGPDGQHIDAELGREQAAELDLQPGREVRVQAVRLSLFEGERAAG
jgi:sulfate transport system ATP-binding protein